MALNWYIFRKNRVVCHERGAEILAYVGHCLANFQSNLVYGLEVRGFTKCKSRSCKDSRFQLTLNQTSGVFWDTQKFLE